MTDLETRLRTTLSEHATHAPPGAALAERVLAEVEAPARVLRPRRGWRTWTAPLLAVGAVAAVVAAVVGIQSDRHTASPPPPGVSLSVPASPAPTPTTTATTSPIPKATQVAPAPDAKTRHVSHPTAIGVTHFMGRSSTFVSDDEGWVLGAADCLDPTGPANSDGTCPALLHTTDGGRTWSVEPNPPGNTPGLGCADPCIDTIRYANDQIGYAFSATTLEMTTDGGKTWSTSAGGALALETLNGNAIRVEQTPGCTTALCSARVESAPIGSSEWTVVETLPKRLDEYASGNRVQLVRRGHRAMLVTFADVTARGRPAESTATVYSSTDDGGSWAERPEPCARLGRSLITTSISLSDDGSLHVMCSEDAEAGRHYIVLTSTDGGNTLTPSPTVPFGPDNGRVSAASVHTLLIPTYRGLQLSVDGGLTWQFVIRDQAGVGDAPGFEDDHVGRWLSDAGRTIWTTHDGGKTWTAFDFS